MFTLAVLSGWVRFAIWVVILVSLLALALCCSVMAQAEGRKAYMDGLPMSANPYGDTLWRSAWIAGYLSMVKKTKGRHD